VSDLKFKRVEPDEDCEIKMTFLNNHDQVNCTYKLSGQNGEFLAHAFYLEKVQFAGISILILKLDKPENSFGRWEIQLIQCFYS